MAGEEGTSSFTLVEELGLTSPGVWQGRAGAAGYCVGETWEDGGPGEETSRDIKPLTGVGEPVSLMVGARGNCRPPGTKASAFGFNLTACLLGSSEIGEGRLGRRGGPRVNTSLDIKPSTG